jgi:plastocyanin
MPALAFAALALPASGADLAGKLVLREKNKTLPRENRSALLWFTPKTPAKVQVPAKPFEMTTVRKEFLPRVLAVPIGARVRFPNQDPILHNVFSVSGENRFDLGLYKHGEAKEAHFRQAGVVNVFCNVHHSMVGYIVVLDSPFSTAPSPEGAFELTGLPPGPGTLTVWHERADPKRIELTLPLSQPLAIELELTKPRIPPHRNKFGQPYERERGKAY